MDCVCVDDIILKVVEEDAVWVIVKQERRLETKGWKRWAREEGWRGARKQKVVALPPLSMAHTPALPPPPLSSLCFPTRILLLHPSFFNLSLLSPFTTTTLLCLIVYSVHGVVSKGFSTLVQFGKFIAFLFTTWRFGPLQLGLGTMGYQHHPPIISVINYKCL